MPFENWSAGEELYQGLDREHDLLDRDFRPFVEECDQLQAVQVLAETDNAWGGFVAKYVDALRDEYGKNSIWMWAIEDGTRVTRVSIGESEVTNLNLMADRSTAERTD